MTQIVLYCSNLYYFPSDFILASLVGMVCIIDEGNEDVLSAHLVSYAIKTPVFGT